MEIKKVALSIGIAVLTTLFIVFLIDAVYTLPEYSDYCNETFYPPQPVKLDIQNCTEINTEHLANQCYNNEGEIRFKYDSKGCAIEAYCEYCVKDYNKANSNYNKNIFYVSAIIGILLIVFGLYLPKRFDPISSGLIFAGILLITQGTIRVFLDLGKISRVVILGIELAILLWIGFKRVIEKKK